MNSVSSDHTVLSVSCLNPLLFGCSSPTIADDVSGPGRCGSLTPLTPLRPLFAFDLRLYTPRHMSELNSLRTPKLKTRSNLTPAAVLSLTPISPIPPAPILQRPSHPRGFAHVTQSPRLLCFHIPLRITLPPSNARTKLGKNVVSTCHFACAPSDSGNIRFNTQPHVGNRYLSRV